MRDKYKNKSYLNCFICNKKFHLKFSAIKKGRGKCCSKKCLNLYQFKKQLKNCLICEKDFFIIPSRIKNGWSGACSRRCYNIFRQNSRQKIQCINCKKLFFTSIALIKRGQGKFCSEICQYQAYRSDEWRNKTNMTRSGELCPAWKGGVTPLHKLIRHSKEYLRWRKYVFERDNYTCQICNKRGGKLHADHILPFAFFPLLRFKISNGRTLCINCHRLTSTYGGKVYAYMKEVIGNGIPK